MKTLTTEDINTFIENQLLVWPLAKQNYDALANVERRLLQIGSLPLALQFNPARMISTAANTDAAKNGKRPCFLCKENRPDVQMGIDFLPGWELLVNPYPVFPVHLVIASTTHRPQESVPFEIVEAAEKLPGMAVFFNGATAGASAPDHIHMQAVLKDELPLLRFVETLHPDCEYGLKTSGKLMPGLPYLFVSGVVAPGNEGMATLLAGLKMGGPSSDGKLTEPSLVNTFFWKEEGRPMRFIVVPRIKHRPSCYFASDDNTSGVTHRMTSPGCIDMVGVYILPREKDFREITSEELSQIFSEVALPSD